MIFKNIKRTVFIILILLGISNIHAQVNISKFSVSISSANTTFKAGSPVVIIMEISNKTNEVVDFLKFQTPFEGMKSNCFKVIKKSKRLPFTGTIQKSMNPTKSDFITLAGANSEEVSTTISDYYDFSKKGTYTIQFTGNSRTNKLPYSNTLEITIN